MRVDIEITEDDVKRLILDKLREDLKDPSIELFDIQIETKSAQNYRSEWETAKFRAKVTKVVI